MSFPEPSSNGSSASPVQRLLIAVGTLIVVALTVVAAILLAVRNPESSATGTPISTPTAVAVVPSLTPTPRLLPTSAPSATPSPSPSPAPTQAPTNTPPPPPPATNTPVPPPPPPVFTPTPIIVVVTPTPLPAPLESPPSPSAGTAGVCQAPSGWIPYVAQVGDTMNSLAERTGASVYDLQQVNCLTNLTIQPGQTIYLPFTPPTSTVTPTNTPTTPTATPTLTGTPTPTPRAPEIFTADVSVDRKTLFVTGRNFRPDENDFRVELRGTSGTTQLTLGELRSSTSFEAKLPSVADLPAGVYDLRVINPDGQFDILRVILP